MNTDHVSGGKFGSRYGSVDWASSRLPRRSSLVHETIAALREWIRSGVLTGELPGELQLKSRLGVGRDTLRLALKQLAREGWVSPATRGCPRRVRSGWLLPRQTASEDHLPVTFLSPHPVEHRLTLLEMEDTQIRLAEQGRSLRFVSPPLFHLKSPERQLERLVRAHPSAAWVLYITNQAIQRWFAQRGLPAFLYELPFPGVNLPFVASDWEGAAFHAGLQLVRNGHRVIGLLEYQDRRPGLLVEERGLERALEATHCSGRLLFFKDDGTPASVARSLEAAFGSTDRPSALVLTRAAQLLTCYSWLASRGLRVPADVSMVSLANDTWFTHLHPAVSYYRPDSRRMSRSIAERVLELAATGQLARKSLRVRLDYVPGSTVGRVPAGVARVFGEAEVPRPRSKSPAARQANFTRPAWNEV